MNLPHSSLFLLLTLLHIITSLHTNNLHFYQSQYSKNPSLNPNLELYTSAERNLTLFKTYKDLPANSRWFTLHSDNFISGCQYYPHKKIIFKLITDYFNDENQKKIIPHYQIFVHTFTLIYQILFYHFERDMSRYSTTSKFYSVNISDNIGEYINTIISDKKHASTQHSTKEAEFIKKLHLDNNSFTIAENLFNHIKEKVHEMPESKKKELEVFIKQRNEFFALYSHITLNAIPIRMEIYIQMHKNEFDPKEVNEFEWELNEEKTPIKNCFVISPLLDLFTLAVNDKTIKSSLVINTSINSENYGLDIISKSPLKQGKIIKSMNIPNENAYFDFDLKESTGFFLRKALLSFHKDRLGTEKRRDICQRTSCEGMAIERDFYKGYFLWSSLNLNPYLINMGRLWGLKEKEINPEKNMDLFKERKEINQENEIVAFVNYFDMLNNDMEKNDFLFNEWNDWTEKIEKYSEKEKEMIGVAYNNIKISLSNIEYLFYGLEKMLTEEIMKNYK